MLSFKCWQILEAVKPPRDIRQIPRYHIRWMIRRDVPEVIQLAKNHPHFSEISKTHGKEGMDKTITQLLRMQKAVGQVAEDTVGKIRGAMIVMLGDKHLEIPFIAADNPDAAYHLINKYKDRVDNPNPEFKKRDALYLQGHLDDPNVLQAMRDHGMRTKLIGDMVHVQYPFSNLKHKNVYDTYNSIVQGYSEEPTPPEPEKEIEDPDDPYGLFKDKPYGK